MMLPPAANWCCGTNTTTGGFFAPAPVGCYAKPLDSVLPVVVTDGEIHLRVGAAHLCC